MENEVKQSLGYVGWKFTAVIVIAIGLVIGGYQGFNRLMDSVDQMCGVTTNMEVLVDE